MRDLGFGFLVLYRGRDSREFKQASDGPAKGNLDARSAVSAARKENFPPGTIIFLDIEEGGRLSPIYHAYLHAWADTLARGGYRAGVYCSGMPAKETGGITIVTADDIRAQAGSREFVFFVYNDACPPSPGCSFPSAAPAPFWKRHLLRASVAIRAIAASKRICRQLSARVSRQWQLLRSRRHCLRMGPRRGHRLVRRSFQRRAPLSVGFQFVGLRGNLKYGNRTDRIMI